MVYSGLFGGGLGLGAYSNVGRYYGGSPLAGYGGASLLNDMGIGIGSQQMRYDSLPGAYGLGFGGGGIGGLGALGLLGGLGGAGGLGGGIGSMMIGFVAAQAIVGMLTAFAGGGRNNDDCGTCSRQQNTYNGNFGNYSNMNENFDNGFQV